MIILKDKELGNTISLKGVIHRDELKKAILDSVSSVTSIGGKR